MSTSISTQEMKGALRQVNAKVAKKLDINVVTAYDLRTAKSEKKRIAAQHPFWTLFINRKGNMCHAVHRTGAVLILESPESVHDCFHEEHAVNYFVNHMRDITNLFFK